ILFYSHHSPTFSLITYIAISLSFFFFNDPATTEISTLSLHDALPIFVDLPAHVEVPAQPLEATEHVRLGRDPNLRSRHDVLRETVRTEQVRVEGLGGRLTSRSRANSVVADEAEALELTQFVRQHAKETVVRVLLRHAPATHASLTADVREDARVTNQDVRTARVGRDVVLEELETSLDDVLGREVARLDGRGDVREDLVLDQFVDDLRRLVRQDA